MIFCLVDCLLRDVNIQLLARNRDAVLTEHRVSFFCLKDSLFADHEITVSCVPLTVRRLHGKKAFSAERHICIGRSCTERTLGKIFVVFIGFYTKTKLSDYRSRIGGSGRYCIHSVKICTAQQKLRKRLLNRDITFIARGVHVG